MQRLLRALLLLGLIAVTLPTVSVGSAPAHATVDSVFGINSHSASRYPEVTSLNVPADAVANLKVGWAREDFQISRILPQVGQFDWSFHDATVNELTARGIQIVGLLNGPTPAWAAPGTAGGDFFPPDPQSFASFAGSVVGRYKDRIKYWEVWNEPDNAVYWKPNPDPAAYANLLKATAAAIRAADPNARILVAGMVTPEPAVSFLTTIAAQGAWDSFDILSIHPYTDPKGPEEGQINSAGVGQIRALAERLGNKPIWATEFGWSTGAGGRGGVAFDEESQANYLVRGATLLRAAGVERVLWYKLKDNESNEQYGLLSLGTGAKDYSHPKAAFTALRTLSEQVGSSAPLGMLDLGQRSVVADFETFGTWKRGDQANGTFAQSSEQHHSGSYSGKLSYSFPSGGNDYVVFQPSTQPAIEAGATQFGAWIYGDGSGHALKVWLRDNEGETLQFRLGFIGGSGWQFLSASILTPVEPYNRVSGNGNLRLDLPAKVTAMVLDDEPDTYSGSGAFYIDDMTTVGGVESYGARFSRGSDVVDVLWAMNNGSVTIPTSSGQGRLIDRWGSTSTVSSNNGQFTIQVGLNPVYLIHSTTNPQPQPPTTQPTAQPQPPTTVPTASTPPADQRCFPETGFCMAGRIREFWEQNGGLPVFGYPIGPQGQELIEGKPYQVQWFERNRLELHPENGRPYDVLLGRLGADRLTQQGRDWTAFPKTGSLNGCRFFPETGHSVCGDILAAWLSNGLEIDGKPGKTEGENLALFGLPLSGPIRETLSDGREYVVQWFERARFEQHPENQPPYNVLLGLLGNEIRGRR